MSQEPITTYCPACGKAFRVPPDLNGKKILCKACQTHFVVQADRPGLPAAPPPPPIRPAGTPPMPAAHTAHGATPPRAPSAPINHPPVTAATAAPVAVPPPPVDALAPIPFDDFSTPGATVSSLPSVAKPAEMGKVKIESKGPYYVIKLVTAGKMIHVNIENSLNEHAADGWKLEHIVTAGGELYAIFSRFDGQHVGEMA